MAIIESAINYETGKFRAKFTPIGNLEGASRQGFDVGLELASHLVAFSPGLERILESVLEYGRESYAVEITGTATEFTVLGGSHIGYSISVEIYPRFVEGGREDVKELP